MGILKTVVFLTALVNFTNAQESTGFFQYWFSYPIDLIRSAVTKGQDLSSHALDVTLSNVNGVTRSLINTRKGITNETGAIASKSADITTQGVSNIAGIIAGLVPNDTLVGAVANTGAMVVGAGARTLNAGIQTGISTLSAIDNARLNLLHNGITTATGVAGSLLNSVLNIKKTGEDYALNIIGAGASAVGATLDHGLEAVRTGVHAVGSLANKVQSMSNEISQEAMKSLYYNTIA